MFSTHIEFFSFSLLSYSHLFLHIKLKTEITFSTMEQHSKGSVTQPREKADNRQENVMKLKSNSIWCDSQGERICGKESPKIRVKFIFSSHNHKSNIMQQQSFCIAADLYARCTVTDSRSSSSFQRSGSFQRNWI